MRKGRLAGPLADLAVISRAGSMCATRSRNAAGTAAPSRENVAAQIKRWRAEL